MYVYKCIYIYIYIQARGGAPPDAACIVVGTILLLMIIMIMIIMIIQLIILTTAIKTDSARRILEQQPYIYIYIYIGTMASGYDRERNVTGDYLVI